jgi:hypothetical protein
MLIFWFQTFPQLFFNGEGNEIRPVAAAQMLGCCVAGNNLFQDGYNMERQDQSRRSPRAFRQPTCSQTRSLFF